MSTYRFDKLFTLQEADALLPALELLVRDLQTCVRDLRTRIADLVERDPALAGMQLPELVERYPELSRPASRMAQLAHEIESRGCFLKDVDLGLIDFPWEKDDDEVAFLCWQPGEPRLVAWHPIEGGFAQRRPLPGAGRQYLN
ncbi:MAG TPA: DUF2203 domain-containing protein [Candidatus Binataceae bacterium]|nr:DUF2203 domain-containing protein [Candidatus Binataceae bacterium]